MARVVVVDPVVVPAQRHQVGQVCFPALRPSLDVVEFAQVSAHPAARHGAHRGGNARQVALFRVGHALSSVQVHRPCLGVHERNLRREHLAHECGDVLRAGDGRAVGEPEQHVVAAVGEDCDVPFGGHRHDGAWHRDLYPCVALEDLCQPGEALGRIVQALLTDADGLDGVQLYALSDAIESYRDVVVTHEKYGLHHPARRD